ncbi:predicted protein [Botrytis cinerea T4]|uniref:Uncharacterized protein n=1 Tax=Botryotinia fuckeliana (strain T4) TaxID=999810 RepID=G2YRB8_BOTF4|nr:predicted protein [Botrytis cinerea T4]
MQGIRRPEERWTRVSRTAIRRPNWDQEMRADVSVTKRFEMTDTIIHNQAKIDHAKLNNAS